MTNNIDVRFSIDFNRNLLTPAPIDVTPYVTQASWDLGSNDVEKRVAFDGKATLTLNNETGIFTPNNSEGAYYEKILPSLPVIIELKKPDDSWERLWSGYIVDWEFTVDSNQAQTVIVSCSQTYQLLDREGVTIPIIENANASDIVTSLATVNKYLPPLTSAFFLDYSALDESSLTDPSQELVLGTATSDFSLYGFDLGNSSTFREALEEVAQAEQGLIFFDRESKLNFVGFADIVTDETVADLDESHFKGLQYSYGKPLYNEIKVEYSPKTLKTNTTIIQQEIQVQAGEKTQIELNPKSEGEVSDIVIKSVTNVGYSGSVSVSLISYNAKAVLVNVVNPTTEAVSTTVTVTGDAYVTSNTETVKEVDISSITLLKKSSPITISLGTITKNDEGKRLAQKYKMRYSKPKGFFKQGVITSRYPTLLSTLKTGLKFAFEHVNLNEQNEYIVIGESGNWIPQNLEMTYFFDLANRINAFILDESRLDNNYVI